MGQVGQYKPHLLAGQCKLRLSNQSKPHLPQLQNLRSRLALQLNSPIR